jgi:hypothetical protein
VLGHRCLGAGPRKSSEPRSRVSFFMNKFRKLGSIDYNGKLEVHSSLLNIVLHDQPQIRRPSEVDE